MFSWTPYAVATFIAAFISPDGVGPFNSLLPCIFAKSSMVWSSMFYLYTNKRTLKKKKNKRKRSMELTR